MALKKQQKLPSNSLFYQDSKEESPFPPPQRIRHTNLLSLLLEAAADRPPQSFVRFRDITDGEWSSLSWAEAFSRIAAFSEFLRSQCRVKPKEQIAIISGTRFEWLIAELACLFAGASTIPLDPSRPSEEFAAIFKEGSSKCVFVDSENTLDKLRGLRFDHLVSFEKASKESTSGRRHNLEDIISKSESPQFEDILKKLQRLASNTGKQDIATTLFCQNAQFGATFSHAQLISAIDSMLLSGLCDNGRDLFYGRSIECAFSRTLLFAALSLGGDVVFPTSAELSSNDLDYAKLFKDIRQTHPRTILADSEFLRQTRSSINAATASGARKKLSDWALKTYPDLKEKIKRTPQLGARSALKQILCETVLSKMRVRCLGSRQCSVLVPGPLEDEELLGFFSTLAIPVLEFYSSMPFAPIISACTRKGLKLGSQGRRFEDIELAIDSGSNELFVKSPSLGKPVSKEGDVYFSNEGWLCTKVKANFDDKGYLRILTIS